MKKKLLLSTAALLAGMSLASAQQMPGGQTSGQQHPQSAQGQSSQAQKGAQEQGRQGQAQRSESSSQRDLTTGQGSQQGSQQRSQRGSQGAQTQQGKEGQRAQHNAQPQTQGQAPRNQQGQSEQRQRSQPQQGQAQQPQPQQQGQARQSQPQPGQVQQGQPQPQQSPGATTGRSERMGAQQQTQASGGVTLTNEQRTRIRGTVLARSDFPRVDRNRLDFALVVGTVVPTHVRVVEVPETLVVIHPEWRGYEYFVVEDDVIIVDHSRRIIATLPVGTQSSAIVRERGSSTAMHLSREEIRQVQIMLNQKGFNVGEPDGIFGQQTRMALLEFQRSQGLQVSAQIDQQTMAALHASGTTGQQGNQSQRSTTGQAGQPGTGMNQPGAANQGRGQTSTTGQGNPPAQQPAAPNAAPSSSMPRRQPR